VSVVYTVCGFTSPPDDQVAEKRRE